MLENIDTLWPSLATGLGTVLKHGAGDEMIKSLNYFWYSKVGYKAERAAKLKKIDNKQLYEAAENELNNFAKFKEEIEEKLSKIEKEHLKNPIDYIAHPAIDQSDAYISEPIFRQMFASLIAASMDSSKLNAIHSSFVQIIKELTPLDAKLLKTISIEGNDHIAKLGIKVAIKGNNGDSSLERIDHLYIADEEYKENTLTAPSIDNLIRLGLVSVNYNQFRIYSERYDEFKETPEYTRLETEIKSPEFIKKSLSSSFIYDLNPEFFENTFSVDMKKGIIVLTNLGKNFYQVCL